MRYTGCGFIFAGERKGKPLNLENLAQRIMSPALTDGWKGWHGFRRGLGSNLYNLGVPPKVIQEGIGARCGPRMSKDQEG
jgi:hypothetical protein